ncbi:MAG: alpha/beta hydrolase family protein [Acidimicrobiia bacterium]|nr:alpha/beta hydrolase family protein [Acidimicrobiia bacterium]
MIHPIDRAAAVMLHRGPQRVRVFPGGWGEERYVRLLREPQLMLTEPPVLDISWAPTKHLTDRRVRDGRFPTAADVPWQAATAAVRVVEPPHGTDRLCLLMAAWNDHGYRTRQQIADELLHHDIGSIILEIPYHGSRRVVSPDEQPIRTVADFARMGLGAVTEGRALLRHFGSDYKMGVSGYSMGGNIGAAVGATAGFPVAMAPLAASHSPGPVFLDGAISNRIVWEALGGVNQEQALRDALSSVSVLELPVPEWAAAAVMMAGRSDGFVPRSAIEALHHHWPGSELRWCRGGHATVIWRRRKELAATIADSFARLEALQKA